MASGSRRLQKASGSGHLSHHHHHQLMHQVLVNCGSSVGQMCNKSGSSKWANCGSILVNCGSSWPIVFEIALLPSSLRSPLPIPETSRSPAHSPTTISHTHHHHRHLSPLIITSKGSLFCVKAGQRAPSTVIWQCPQVGRRRSCSTPGPPRYAAGGKAWRSCCINLARPSWLL